MPASEIGQTERPSKNIKLTLILVILLSIISFVTSYKGLVILNVENDNDLSLWQNIFIAFMVFTIQATLVVTLLFMIHGYRRITRFLSLSVYIVAMLFSVFFSYGWWYEVFRADSYAQEVYKDGVESIRTNAKTYEQSFSNVREVADELSKYSAKRARDENLYGGTCDEKSLPGKGALNYLRNDEAKRFGNIAEDVGGLQEKVGKHISELNRLLDDLDLSEEGIVAQRERELNDIVALIGGYREGSESTRIRKQLEERRGDKRKFLESQNPKTDERTVVSCLDTEITRKIDALIAALDALPEPRKVTLFDQNNNRTVLQRSWQVFASLMDFDTVTDTKAKLAELNLTSTDYVPLVAGLLIDLFILVLGLIDGLEHGRAYTGRRYSKSEAKAMQDFHQLPPSENDQISLLQPYLYNGWFSHYLILPISQATSTEREQQLRRLVSWLEAHDKIDRFAHGVALERLPRIMQEFFTMETPANQWRKLWRFDVYKVNKDVWRELIIAHALNRQTENQTAQKQADTESQETQVQTDEQAVHEPIEVEVKEQAVPQPTETKEQALQRIMRGHAE
ncbi:MAG: Unknown protein [uncultured Thiotrichaceae bacterium]|uniref:Uncharacterized protein n=1 Tax=uncultured Thiotrichaceae bacterium TaxID=298394 RepID=A0A6S6TU54_9GAMM|nr:MAG: Unknown protein [uncultured Thiotrichaceae bacterium]